MVELHDKVWGSEEWIANSELYCGKVLNLKSGVTCSVHFHKLKDETFYVLSGDVAFLKNSTVFILSEGESVHVPINTPHCFGGIGEAKILEVSTQHFEDDSYRVTSSGLVFDGLNLHSFEEAIRLALIGE